MKGLTYIAGAAVVAMVAMAAMPNDAAAVPAGQFGFTPVGGVTLNGDALANIDVGITTKQYANSTVNIGGTGVFSSITSGLSGGALAFNVPTANPDNIPDFNLTFGGFTFNFTTGDLITQTSYYSRCRRGSRHGLPRHDKCGTPQCGGRGHPVAELRSIGAGRGDQLLQHAGNYCHSYYS